MKPISARATGLAGVMLVLGAAAVPAMAGGVSGQVTNAAGQGVAGVFVTARDTASGIETTVYSTDQGRYVLPALSDGHYELRAHHARYEDARGALEIGAAQASLDFALNAAREPLRQAATATWFAHVKDGADKREFILNCMSCHELSFARLYKDGALRTRQQWLDAFALMKSFDKYAVIPPDFDFEHYADWLTREFTVERVANIAPPALAPREAQAEITEYPVPIASELPHDLVVGPDHRVWVTAFWNSAMWALDPASGHYESFEVNDEPKVAAQVRALAFAHDGTLWLVNGGTESVVRLDPRTRKFVTYKVGIYPHDIALDSHGDVWLNDYFGKTEGIARLAANDGSVKRFALPSAHLPASAGIPLPYGMQVDGQDRLWSAQLAANTLARYDIASGEAKLYTMPGDNVGPRRMAVAPDGRIWIAEFNTGRVTSFEPATEKFESFDTGIGAAGIYDVEVDPRNGDVWLAAALASELIHLDGKTHRLTRYPLPTEPAYMRHLAIDPRNGEVWSAYSSLPTAAPKVVRLRRLP
jgi:virginiamycin B lyase